MITTNNTFEEHKRAEENMFKCISLQSHLDDIGTLYKNGVKSILSDLDIPVIGKW